MVYVLPIIVLNVDHIGGPNFAIKSFLEGTLAASTDNPDSCPIQAALNWGLQVTAGAKFHIGMVNGTHLHLCLSSHLHLRLSSHVQILWISIMRSNLLPLHLSKDLCGRNASFQMQEIQIILPLNQLMRFILELSGLEHRMYALFQI
jgi:hypothetical protein